MESSPSDRNIRNIASRPELGSHYSAAFSLLAVAQSKASTCEGSTVTFSPSRNRPSVISQFEALPIYSTFDKGPKLSSRRRPRPKRKTAESSLEPEIQDDGASAMGSTLLSPECSGQNLAASPESLHTYEQSVDQPNDEYSSRYGGIIQTDNPMSDDEALQESYLFQVLQSKSAMFVDEATVIVVKDYDVQSKLLKKHSFCFVKRMFVEFIDRFSWVFTCSCNDAFWCFADALGQKWSISFNDYQDLLVRKYPPCLHIKVCKIVVEAWDMQNCNIPTIEPAAEDENEEHTYNEELPAFVELSFARESLVCVRSTDGGYGVVGMDMGGFKCLTCLNNRRSCKHVTCLNVTLSMEKATIPEFLIDFLQTCENLKTSFPKNYVRKAVSERRIPMETLPSQRTVFNGLLGSTVQLTDENVFQLVPDFPDDVTECPVCGDTCSVFWENDKKRLLTQKNIIDVYVPYLKCNKEMCPHTKLYDGCRKGVLNMGSFLIGHDVLRDYLHHFVSGNSQSLSNYLIVWKMNLAAAGYKTECCLTYHQWRVAWYSFFKLLQVDVEGNFFCSRCGGFPRIILCDATSLSFRRVYARKVDIEDQMSTLPKLKGSSFKKRVFIEEATTRQVLMKFCSEKQLERSNRESLDAKYPYLLAVINECETIFSDAFYFPKGIWMLLRSLASVSPVCSYYPPVETLSSIMARLSSGLVIQHEPESFAELQSSAPIIYAALAALPPTPISVNWQRLFGEMQAKAQYIFSIEKHDLASSNCTEESYSFFPYWPLINQRGVYDQDVKNEKSRDRCKKAYPGHPNLLPGLFTVYCEHGVCYGFQVMECQESPNIPFSVIRTRYMTAPDCIIYDNSCNLQSYCLNRDPGFFKNTMFLVDRFHWKNHTGCADSYNVSLYPKYDKLNTQINEQQNSLLKALRSQLSYMTPTNFMNHCMLFMYFRNIAKKTE